MAVIGAGFSGIASAIKLLDAGIKNFVILERGDRVGGTWRDAVYPGAEVDVPSWLYSLSYAPNPDWSTLNSPAEEILAYIEDLVIRYELASFIRYGSNVSQIEFDEGAGRWTVKTGGTDVFHARAVIAADGLPANSGFPTVPGLDTFDGKMILSARWDCAYDYSGKRIAVIGTGASAVQIVPELVGTAAQVTVFQRTPAWVIPRSNFRVPGLVKKLFRRFPAAQQAVRTALFGFYELLTLGLVYITPLTKVVETLSLLHLRIVVRDRVLRQQLTPDYRVGCKRPLITSAFYPALQRANSALVPFAVTEITAEGLRAADGSEHEFDCIIFATGYDVGGRGSAFTVAGIGGRILGDEWAKGMVGYKSVNVSGYPNLFWMLGPNAFGHSSELLFIEEQIRYAVHGIREILNKDLCVLDVRPEAQATHNEELQHKLRRTTFSSGCHSWYLSDGGYNGMMFPGSVSAYRRQMATFDLGDYVLMSVKGEVS